MINIKGYAEKKGTSYEAVRKQVARYRNELGDHITVRGKTQYLDEEAIAFLDGKRAENPVVVIEQNKEDNVKQLTDENRTLFLQLTGVQQQLIATQQQLLQTKSRIVDADLMQKLLDAKDVTVEEQRCQIAERQKKIAQLEAESLAQRAEASAESEKMRKALDEKDVENRAQAQKLTEQAARIEELEAEAAEREKRMRQMKNRNFLERLLNRENL